MWTEGANMADTLPEMRPERLGVGSIIGETFSTLFGRFGYVALLGIVPALILVLLQLALFPEQQQFTSNGIEFGAENFGLLLFIVVQSFVTALIVRMTYDTRLGHPIRVGSYVSTAFASIIWIAICSVIVTILVAAAAFVIFFIVGIIGRAIGSGAAVLLLIIPSFALVLYVYGIWIAVAPAVVIENAGIGGLARSFRLTSGYRWPIAGTLFLLMVIAMLPVFLFSAILGFALAEAAIGIAQVTITIAIFQAIVYGLIMSFFGIATALIYARLREIKEGTSVEQLADVFA